MPAFAHGGGTHWAESIMYLIPVVGFGIWLGVTAVKDRRQGRDRAADEAEAEARAEAEVASRAERHVTGRDARQFNGESTP